MASGPPFRTASDAVAADAFFKGRPRARKTFDQVSAFMAACGPMERVSTKSRVAFVACSRFLWVHTANLDGSITIGFLLPRHVESSRLRSGAVGKGNRWSHHVKLDELDTELKAWFRGAYEWDRHAIKDARVPVQSAPGKRPA
ncbi:MAG TPA: DUF5655 domain-containing protein [Candidatus Thermoplasmatota archaeon]|nr:DUF5655 domain-containing protein [Candidatus Thermoplasmatota archaeon]